MSLKTKPKNFNKKHLARKINQSIKEFIKSTTGKTTRTVKIRNFWVVRQFSHEYNPVHIHQGKLYTGLSSVMILKLPKETGVEYSAEEKPMNGRLQIIGAANGQFSKTDYSPNMKIGDFYVFPYDMRHCVYPFNGTKEKRRTLVCNVDVDYNPVASRTGSGQNE